ncbi:MAG TPA: T9SS type A sorting domain-containing protein [Flavobacterium sp.]|nr:T9SS type A sorting domain-containing protein [Flavobacterium sp.]
MRKNYFLALGLLFSAFATQAQTQYVDGILVLNEGGAGTNNASVSYINAAGQVSNYIFQTANNVNVLGDVAQGMATDGEVTLIMLNNSDKIEVVDAKTFVLIETIDEGIVLPRYAVIHEGKAYVTCWGEDDEAYMAIIDMETYAIEDTVSLAPGVEQIYEKDGKIYILHMGGFGTNNIMSVYDIETEEIEEVIVGDSPTELVFYDDYAYVISQGRSWGDILEPSFHRVNLSTLAVEEIDELVTEDDEIVGEYKFIARYEDTFYIKVSADVYTFDVETQTLSEEPIIETGITSWSGVYGMSIIGDKVYLADAKGFMGDAGEVFVYSLDGELENTFEVGDGPNNIYPSAASATSSDQFGKETIKLYPNPATNRVFLTAENNAQIRVFDMLGKELMNTTYQSHGIDISGLSAGTYLMHVQNNKQTQTIRFVKK